MSKRTAFFFAFLVILPLCIVNIHPVNASEESWAPKASMPTARSGLGVAVVDGNIYVIGGSRGINVGYDNNEEYNLITDTWTTKTAMPTPRGVFAIAVFQNKVYCIGGSIRGGTGFNELTNVNEVYNPATDTWETKAPMPMLKSSFLANVVDGKIYIIGGLTQSAPNATLYPSNETFVYDPLLDSWTTKASIPTPVYSYASSVVDNKVYVISGNHYGYTDLNQIYDPTTDTWSYGAPIPIAVQSASAGATTGITASKAIYVVGGFVGFVSPVNLTQVYFPENDTWSSGAAMSTARYGLGVAVVNDLLYAIGGSPFLYQPDLNLNEQYTPLGYTATSPSPFPSLSTSPITSPPSSASPTTFPSSSEQTSQSPEPKTNDALHTELIFASLAVAVIITIITCVLVLRKGRKTIYV